jgi:hypothetical protein
LKAFACNGQRRADESRVAERERKVGRQALGVCAGLALVSRAGFCRWRDASAGLDPDLDLRDEIQQIALEFPYYGWPRIRRELGDRGWRVDHKRVYRTFRMHNLRCLRKTKFVGDDDRFQSRFGQSTRTWRGRWHPPASTSSGSPISRTSGWNRSSPIGPSPSMLLRGA